MFCGENTFPGAPFSVLLPNRGLRMCSGLGGVGRVKDSGVYKREDYLTDFILLKHSPLSFLRVKGMPCFLKILF